MERVLYIYNSMANGTFNLEICPVIDENEKFYAIINTHGVKVVVCKSTIENESIGSIYKTFTRDDEKAIKILYKALEHDRAEILKYYLKKVNEENERIDNRINGLRNLNEINAPKDFTRDMTDIYGFKKD